MLSRRPAVACGAFLFAGLVALAGCGPDHKARAVVKGLVTINGKHLTSGTVMFYCADGRSASAPIGTDGRYTMNDAPIGDCKVTVTVIAMPPGPSVMKGAGMKAMKRGSGESKDPEGGSGIPMMSDIPENIVRIPDKYKDPDKSGLTYKVERGEHVHDIKL